MNMNRKLRWFAVLLPSLLALISTALGEEAAIQQASASEAPCYAFQNNGDIYVSCQGRKEKVTDGGTVIGFAVARDGSSVVLNRHKFRVQGEGSVEQTPDRVEIISLEGDFPTRTLPGMRWHRLVPSCGTVLVFAPPQGSSAQDLLHGSRLCFEDYVHFRCSADRSVVAGVTAANREVLKTGVPPQRQIVAAPPQHGRILYDVSPNGRFVGYYWAGELCVSERDGGRTCIHFANSHDRLSVSDSGEIVLDVGTGETCYFRDMWHGSLEPLPGYDEGDECMGVGYWKPGERAPRILERLGRNPQWITPRAAEALFAWHSRTENSKETRR
jgi:hypothetical protein